MIQKDLLVASETWKGAGWNTMPVDCLDDRKEYLHKVDDDDDDSIIQLRQAPAQAKQS